MNPNKRISFILLLSILILVSCTQAPAATTEAPQEPEIEEVILATTTSTQDSGLLDVLVPDFEAKTGFLVQTVAVGTGKALAMGDGGNADVLLVHAPSAEMALMDSGSGADRMLIMHNDFVIVGPTNDLAGIEDIKSASQALQAISESGAAFVSRGDDSGTHKKEKSLWEESGVTPEGEWYIESGQGMGATLRIASEKLAYTLTDRATYLANRDTLDLAILVEGDPVLLNIYHVITVNPEKWPKVNYQGALAFAEYLVSPEVQDTIGEFGVDKFGQPLFFPDAGKTDTDLGNP